MKARICVALPCYGNHATAGISTQIAGLLFALSHQLKVIAGDQDWSAELQPTYYQSNNIVNARSVLVRRFLEHPAGYTHLLFWDADVVGTQAQIATILTRMLKADRPIIGAPYVQKHIWWEQAARAGLEQLRAHPETTAAELAHVLEGFAVRYVPDLSALPIVDVVDDIAELPSIPIGFSLLRRDMLEKMTDHYKDLTYEKISPFTGETERTVALFAMTLQQKILRDEDYAFTDRWRAMGGRLCLYVGEGAPLGHVGSWQFSGTRDALLSDWTGFRFP